MFTVARVAIHVQWGARSERVGWKVGIFWIRKKGHASIQNPVSTMLTIGRDASECRQSVCPVNVARNGRSSVRHCTHSYAAPPTAIGVRVCTRYCSSNPHISRLLDHVIVAWHVGVEATFDDEVAGALDRRWLVANVRRMTIVRLAVIGQSVVW